MEIEDTLAQVKPFQEVEAKRRRHEQDMARTRRGFWETHDIDRWAATAFALKTQQETKADWALLMAELPDSAIGPLWRRVDRTERATLRERLRKADDALEARMRSPSKDDDDDGGQIVIPPDFRPRGRPAANGEPAP